MPLAVLDVVQEQYQPQKRYGVQQYHVLRVCPIHWMELQHREQESLLG